MDPRERLLGIGKLYLMRGEPIPLTLLSEAEELGLSLELFGLSTTSTDEDCIEKETSSYANNNQDQEGDI